MIRHQKIVRDDLTTRVAHVLRTAILGGQYRPGDRLPPERDLAVEFGVDRNTLRSAIQELEQLGLVQRRQGSGCRVLDYRETATLDLLKYLVTKPGTEEVDPAVIQSVLDIARVTSAGIVDLVVERADADDLSALHTAADRMADAIGNEDPSEVADAQRWLVRLVFRASHSVAAELVLNTYEQVYDSALDPTGEARRRWAEEMIDHGGVDLHLHAIESLERRDGPAARGYIDQILREMPGVIAAGAAAGATAQPKPRARRRRSRSA